MPITLAGCKDAASRAYSLVQPTLNRNRNQKDKLHQFICYNYVPVSFLNICTQSFMVQMLPHKVVVPAINAFGPLISISCMPILCLPSANPNADMASVTSINPKTIYIIHKKVYEI